MIIDEDRMLNDRLPPTDRLPKLSGSVVNLFFNKYMVPPT